MPSPPPQPGRPVRHNQVAAVASLVVLPLLVYGLPAVLGHPVVPGDDLTQSLPLRELVGSDLRSGHLPIFDPYIWGGAPLLAGWNAGAAYPLTWLFAVVPGAAAWTVNLMVAGVTAGVGCFAFLRASRLGVLASWAGAMTFTFGGGMIAQIPHVGLVIGMSWVPLALLAVLRLTDPGGASARSLAWWTAVLAAAVALVILAGEPRAVTDAAAVLALYGGWRLVKLARFTGLTTSWRGAGAVVSGVLLGVGLGAVQLVPGLDAVATSQRAQVTAQLFGAGSLPIRWLTLLGVPDLLGGSGSFGQPVFFANYNLTEVSGYVGLLPLVAAVALFARLRRRRPVPEWVVWEVIAVAGILLALGNHTPLWHVLIHIPLVGGQRLQSRGVLVSDLALAVLLAYWLDGWARSPAPEDPSESAAAGSVRSVTSVTRAERLLGAVPMVGVVALVAVALATGPSFLEWMGVGAGVATHETALAPWLVPSLLLALAALALVVAGPRLAPARRGALAATFVVVDLVVFAVATVVAVGAASGSAGGTVAAGVPGGAPRVGSATTASRVRLIAALHLSGRFAVYDPGLLYPTQLVTLGVPDANAVDGTWSVQGYGSIVDGLYADATGVHAASGTGQDVFSPRAATDGVFDSLSTSAVLAPSQYLITPARGVTDTASAPGTRRMAAGARVTWWLGAPLAVRSARVDVRSPSVANAEAGSTLRVGLLTEDGAVDWARLRAPGADGQVRRRHSSSFSWEAVWPSPVDAVGLVVDSRVRALVLPPVVDSAGGPSFVLDGVLQKAIAAPHWRYDGQDGAFAVFADLRAHTPLSLRALPGESLRGAALHRVSGPSLDPSAALVSSPHGVDVVRAVAAVPGWTASWTPSPDGKGTAGTAGAKLLAVHRLGVVQVVRVPAGRGVLTWRYAAPGLLDGEIVAAVALVLFGALVLALVVTGATRRLRHR